MKALLVLLVLIAVGIVGLGFYRGWFAFASDKTDHKSEVTLTVDKDKMKDDKDMAKETMQDLGRKVSEKTGSRPEKSTETEKAGESARQP